ncbi:IS66 family transposase [Terrisporobacter vanillatitrophus]|uniref:IS66 family transposase n=1 Tax=Terrisporobacter vanillatitrophus TaxID=3058402 RepID=UPI0033667402
MQDIVLEKELDENTKKLITKMENEIESKDKEIDSLKKEVEILKGHILNKNKKIFGKSSEQVDSNQLSLFNEAEKESDLKVAEPEIEEITYTRKKSTSNIGKKENLSNLEVVVIEHRLEEGEAICNECHSTLVEIGKKEKDILKYEPAKLYVEKHITYSYACKSCEEKTGEANIVCAKTPKTFLHKSMASNEIVAHAICLKYLYSLPLYRQENYFKMLGANLSRQTLSNWIISSAKEFQVVYDLMKEELLKSNYIQADETSLVVIDAKGKESRSKCYMWLYKTGGNDNSIILYEYQKTRSSSYPKSFLNGYSGFLQTDGYNGYNSVSDAKRLYCLAHIRRKYYDIVSTLNNEALKKSRAIIGFNYCEEIYKLEKDLRKDYGEDEDFFKIRYKYRKEKLSSILHKFEKYVSDEIEDALPKSPLGKALEYSKKVLPGMRRVLEDGALEIDNNAAERAIKPFVIGRKNWLFANTGKGAKASATLYSIIETAKSYDLVAEKYLLYLMDNMSKHETLTEEKLLELMPWSATLPENLKIENK